MSNGFPNPYEEPREQSPGELAQEYASLFQMAALLLGVQFTAQEMVAIPVVIGAIMRERKKVDLDKLFKLLGQFTPDV